MGQLRQPQMTHEVYEAEYYSFLSLSICLLVELVIQEPLEPFLQHKENYCGTPGISYDACRIFILWN